MTEQGHPMETNTILPLCWAKKEKNILKQPCLKHKSQLHKSQISLWT